MEKFVLNRLLDKVETRRQASGESLVRRRVSLKTDSLPEYHGRELDYRKAFHQAAENLQRQELLEIEWLRGEQGNLIRALHLNLERLAEAYQAAGRTPQTEVLRNLAEQLTAMRHVYI